ncbi:MAG: TlpA family protein disulfide reductase [Rhodocyclales bacterium]|nr:TlpA family protein disulfide reductase [Rhodocyclales bacterium]
MNSLPPPSPASIERRRAVGMLAGLALAPLLARAQSGGMTALAERPPAPPLALPDLDDQQVDLAAFRGRVVLVNFWATWCPPCRKEFPSLGRLQKLFEPGQLAVLAVNVGEDADTVFAFTGATNFPVLLDRRADALRRWPVKGLPTTYGVDKAGRLALRAVGGREFDDPAVVAQLKELI